MVFICLPSRKPLGKAVCKFVSDSAVFATVFPKLLKTLNSLFFSVCRGKKIQKSLIFWMGKLYLNLSNCMKESLVPACCGSRVLHSASSLDNPKHKWSPAGKGWGRTKPCLFHFRCVHSLLFMDRRVIRMLLGSGAHHKVILSSAVSMWHFTLQAQTMAAIA